MITLCVIEMILILIITSHLQNYRESMTALISFACVNIGQICQIEKGLTFHMARHTFSTTICLSNGISMETLSKMLGHSDIGTTQIYGKITDLKIREDMSQLQERESAEFSKYCDAIEQQATIGSLQILNHNMQAQL